MRLSRSYDKSCHFHSQSEIFDMIIFLNFIRRIDSILLKTTTIYVVRTYDTLDEYTMLHRDPFISDIEIDIEGAQ